MTPRQVGFVVLPLWITETHAALQAPARGDGPMFQTFEGNRRPAASDVARATRSLLDERSSCQTTMHAIGTAPKAE